jgi:flavin-dependent dehydrogenase
VVNSADVLIVGGGPAGLATAIAAALRGFRVTVADPRKPPIEKACGEGLLPEGVAALGQLGIQLNSENAFPIAGIRFCDEISSVSGKIPLGATSFGLRRTDLHQLLVLRAEKLGVCVRWGTRVSDWHSNAARLNGRDVRFRWLVGADGQKSAVRKWAGLGPGRLRSSRLGFRRHFTVAPWSDFVEVYWGRNCQIYVTPTGPREVCVAVLTRDERLRTDIALRQFPLLAARLHDAGPISTEVGGATVLERARSVAHGNVALVGDASFTVDGITGQGLSLAFRQAIALGDALARQNLSLYQKAHREIVRSPARMARLLLLLDRNPWIRGKVLRLLFRNPDIFAKLVARHTGKPAVQSSNSADICDLEWQALRT